jgi:hypothetical protein
VGDVGRLADNVGDAGRVVDNAGDVGRVADNVADAGKIPDMARTADNIEDWYDLTKNSIMKSDNGGSGVRISGAVDEKAIGKVADSAADARKVGVVDDVVEGANKINIPTEGVNNTPSEIAKNWQGSGKYPGVDNYKDIIIKKDTVIYRGEPYGTEYFTTKSAIERSGMDATKIFEGLQVEKNPIHGYRGTMQGYKFNEDIAAAFGITKANPQFGQGGLPQIFVPNVQDLINKGVLVPVDSIPLIK